MSGRGCSWPSSILSYYSLHWVSKTVPGNVFFFSYHPKTIRLFSYDIVTSRYHHWATGETIPMLIWNDTLNSSKQGFWQQLLYLTYLNAPKYQVITNCSVTTITKARLHFNPLKQAKVTPLLQTDKLILRTLLSQHKESSLNSPFTKPQSTLNPMLSRYVGYSPN